MWYVILIIIFVVAVCSYYRILKLWFFPMLIISGIFFGAINYIRYEMYEEPSYYIADQDPRDRRATIWTPEGEEKTILVSNLSSIHYERTDGGLIVVMQSQRVIGYQWWLDPDFSRFQYRYDNTLRYNRPECVTDLESCFATIPENPDPKLISQITLGFPNMQYMRNKILLEQEHVLLTPRYPAIYWDGDKFIFIYLHRNGCVFATDGEGGHWTIPAKYVLPRYQPAWFRINTSKFPPNWRDDWLSYEHTC